jgi:hypothetical protein
VAVTLNFLALVLLAAAAVILALLESVAAVVPVTALNRAGRTAAIASPTGRAVTIVATVASLEATSATASSTSAASTTSTASTTATLAVIASATESVGLPLVLEIRLDALLFALHDDVLFLAHDGELVVVELGLGVECEELLLRVFRVELDKDAALPSTVVFFAALANHDCAVGTEELLKRDLAGVFKVAEVLDIDTGLELVGGGILQAVEEVEGAGLLVLVAFLCGHGKRLCALHCLVASAAVVAVVYDNEILALTQRGDDGRVWAEAAHALEVCDVLDRDWAVPGAAELGEQMLVGNQVVGREVKLDLNAVSDMLPIMRLRILLGCESQQGRPSRASCRIRRCACSHKSTESIAGSACATYFLLF